MNHYTNVTATDLNDTAAEISGSKPYFLGIRGIDRYVMNDGRIVSIQQSLLGRLFGRKIATVCWFSVKWSAGALR